MSIEPGVLYVVATPIGNLGDMTHRAIDVLQHMNVILAEDTRHSWRLLKHYGITTHVLALHDHNEKRSTPGIVARILAGESMALISDSGTPLISDPGYHLVNRLRAQGVRLVPIPGASAFTCALSAAGLPTDRFVFEGFLPAAKSARRRRLGALASEQRTLVFYEAPHRIEACLADLGSAFGNCREAVVARELTKAFESFESGTIEEIRTWLGASANNRKGEFVVLVAGAPRPTSTELGDEQLEVLQVLLEELPLKKAVQLTAKITGCRKNDLYRRAVQMTKFQEDDGSRKAAKHAKKSSC